MFTWLEGGKDNVYLADIEKVIEKGIEKASN